MISNLRVQANTAFKKLVIDEESFNKAGRQDEYTAIKNLAESPPYKSTFNALDHFQLDQEIKAYKPNNQGVSLTSLSVTDKQTMKSHHKAINERKPEPVSLLGELLTLGQNAIQERTKDLQSLIEKLNRPNN